MLCLECQRSNEETSAVSICLTCGAGLCETHRREANEYRTGGVRFGCPHKD